jgi:hypothetical protein
MRLERYISDFLSKAKRKYNLEPEALANLVINHVSRWKQKKPPTLFVIECTESQCLDHIQQIETLWEVNAIINQEEIWRKQLTSIGSSDLSIVKWR